MEAAITILYTNFELASIEKYYSEYLSILPTSIQASINKKKRTKSRYGSLLGRLLLSYNLVQQGRAISTLTKLNYNQNGKPSIGGEAYFSISHSGNGVVCAVDKRSTLGIDLQENRTIENIEKYRQFVHPNEWIILQKTQGSTATIMQLWTKKEALVKCLGLDLFDALKNLDVSGNSPQIDNSRFYFTQIPTENNFSCHLCTVHPNPLITTEILTSSHFLGLEK